MEPLVSVCIAAYRHEKYIRGTLDGILNQKVDFPFEILIHDDASPDATPDIIREYAARWPDIIKPLFEEENQYCRNISMDGTFNFPRAKGRYIALCEGDDYWCDDTKLARQIAYMQAHPDCTFCFTNGTIHDESGTRPDRPFLPYYPEDTNILPSGDGDLQLADLVRLNFIPTASFVFPRETLRALPDSFQTHQTQYGDMRLKLFLTAAGRAHYMARNTVVYRENVPTSAFQIWKREDRAKVYHRAATVVQLAKDVDEYSRGVAAAELARLRREWLRIMAHNAPNLSALHDGEVGEVYRSLPLKEKLRCSLRLRLPEGLAHKLSKIGR